MRDVILFCGLLGLLGLAAVVIATIVDRKHRRGK